MLLDTWVAACLFSRDPKGDEESRGKTPIDCIKELNEASARGEQAFHDASMNVWERAGFNLKALHKLVGVKWGFGGSITTDGVAVHVHASKEETAADKAAAADDTRDKKGNFRYFKAYLEANPDIRDMMKTDPELIFLFADPGDGAVFTMVSHRNSEGFVPVEGQPYHTKAQHRVSNNPPSNPINTSLLNTLVVLFLIGQAISRQRKRAQCEAHPGLVEQPKWLQKVLRQEAAAHAQGVNAPAGQAGAGGGGGGAAAAALGGAGQAAGPAAGAGVPAGPAAAGGPGAQQQQQPARRRRRRHRRRGHRRPRKRGRYAADWERRGKYRARRRRRRREENTQWKRKDGALDRAVRNAVTTSLDRTAGKVSLSKREWRRDQHMGRFQKQRANWRNNEKVVTAGQCQCCNCPGSQHVNG